MKKILLTALCLFSIASFAQNGYFLQPIVGVGTGNINYKGSDNHMTSSNYALTFNTGIVAGYQAGSWRFNTGLVYLRTGATQPITMTDALGNPIGTYNVHYRYSHLVLPVMAGRTFRKAKKLSFTSSVGVGFSYNIGTSEESDFENNIIQMSSSRFNNEYHRFSCFGLLQAELDYRISSLLSISCAPAFEYMLTNMTKNADSYYGYKEYHYTLLLNIGMKWQLPKKEKQPRKETIPGTK